MNPTQYTADQAKDIEERVENARILLEELNLRPSSSVSVVNIGNDVFAQKVTPFLQDTKYSPTVSPIQEGDL